MISCSTQWDTDIFLYSVGFFGGAEASVIHCTQRTDFQVVSLDDADLIWSFLSHSDSGTDSDGLLLVSQKPNSWQKSNCGPPSSDHWTGLLSWCHDVSLCGVEWIIYSVFMLIHLFNTLILYNLSHSHPGLNGLVILQFGDQT